MAAGLDAGLELDDAAEVDDGADILTYKICTTAFILSLLFYKTTFKSSGEIAFK